MEKIKVFLSNIKLPKVTIYSPIFIFSILLLISVGALSFLPAKYFKNFAASFQTNTSWSSSDSGNWNSMITWGMDRGFTFNAPTGVVVAPSGEIYVVDSYNNRVVLLNSDLTGSSTSPYIWNPLDEYGNPYGNRLNTPTGIALSPYGTGELYIVNTDSNRVVIINPDNTASSTWYDADIHATHGSPVNNPYGIAFSSEGEIYIASLHDNAIYVLNADGSASTTWYTSGAYPVGVAVSETGEVYVTVTGGDGTVEVFNKDGSASSTWTVDPSVTFNDPSGIAIDSSTGKIYISDSHNNRIVVLNGDGTLDEETDLGGIMTSPTGIALDPTNDRIFISSSDSDELVITNFAFSSTNTIGGAVLPSTPIEGAEYPGPNDNVVINTGTVTLSDNQNVNNIELASGGTLDLNGHTLNVFGDWTNSGGTLTSNGGTINFSSATGTQSIYGENTFENLKKVGTASSTIRFNDSYTTTVTNDLIITGTSGNLVTIDSAHSSDYGAWSPMAITFASSGKMYEAETGDNYVGIFNTDNSNSTWVDLSSSGESFYGLSIQVLDSGEIIVPFYYSDLVGVFDESGTLLNSYSISNPHSALFAPNGNLYVASYSNENITIIDATTSSVIATYSGFPTVRDMKFASSGDLYVTSGNDVLGLKEDGTIYTLYDGSGYDYHGIAISPLTGEVFLTVPDSDMIEVLNPDGTASTTYNGGPTHPFNTPYGIAIRNDGKIYVADADNSTIVVLNNNGSLDTILPFYTETTYPFTIYHDTASAGTTSFSYLNVKASTNSSADSFTCYNCVDKDQNINWIFSSSTTATTTPSHHHNNEETTTENNTPVVTPPVTTSTTTTTVKLADLIPTPITYTASEMSAGKLILFDSGIKNTGATSTGVFNIQWFVDGDRLGYGSHQGIPSQETVMNGNSFFKWNAVFGKHTIKFVVDPDKMVKESNEENNSAEITVDITATTTSSLPIDFCFPDTWLYPFQNSSLVKYLQIFLNNFATPVATEGVGSIGKESTYYGVQTKNAVANFNSEISSFVGEKCTDQNGEEIKKVSGDNFAFTVSAWIKPGMEKGVGAIITKSVAYQDQMGDFLFEIHPSWPGKLSFKINKLILGWYPDFEYRGNIDIPKDTWSFVTASNNGKGQIKLYVNGVEDTVTSGLKGNYTYPVKGTYVPERTNHSVLVGKQGSTQSYVRGERKEFDGEIKDARTYSKELSLTEIQEIYKSGMNASHTPTDEEHDITCSGETGIFDSSAIRKANQVLGCTSEISTSTEEEILVQGENEYCLSLDKTGSGFSNFVNDFVTNNNLEPVENLDTITYPYVGKEKLGSDNIYRALKLNASQGGKCIAATISTRNGEEEQSETIIPKEEDESNNNDEEEEENASSTISISATSSTTTVATEKSTTTVTSAIVQGYEQIANATIKTVEKFDSVMKTPAGKVTSNTISTIGIVSGTAVMLSAAAFAEPIAFSDIWLIPGRILGLILGALGVKKKQRKWGTVYDSTTKRPIDPVYVSLINIETNEEVDSAITDLDGRYGFVAVPGKYKIVAEKTDYTFPSKKMENRNFDEVYNDLYFGEEITVGSEGDLIIKNIPMDSNSFNWNEFAKAKLLDVNSFIKEKDIVWAKVSKAFFFIGTIASVLTMIFVPNPYNYIIVGLYVIAYSVNYFILKKKESGKIKENSTGIPLSFAIVNIFREGVESPMMKKVTDKYGKYYALVPNGTYFVKVEKKNDDESYQEVLKTELFEVKNGVINKNYNI